MELFGVTASLRFDPPGDVGPLFIILAFLVAAYGVWLYRRTPAPLSPGIRGVLTALRVGLMLLVLAVLARPMLSFPLPSGAEKGVLVLYDRSSSLNLPSGTEDATREDLLQQVRASVADHLAPAYPVVEVPFDAGAGEPVERDQELPPPRGLATNVAESLEQGLNRLGDADAGAVLLVSDGVQTQGPDPIPLARRLGLPVNVVPLGRPDPVQDLSLSRVRANPHAFIGEPTPVEAVLQLHGLPDQRLTVGLWDVTREPVLVDSALAVVQGSGADHRVRLKARPDEGGLRFYEVRAETVTGEQSLENNRRLFALEVRESKTEVVLLSGNLTWDHTFFQRALEADSTLSLVAAYRHQGTWKSRSRIPSTAALLEDARVLILDHLDPAAMNASDVAAVKAWVEGGGGLILVLGGDVNLSRWHSTELSPLLPLDPGGSARGRDVTVQVSPRAGRHPLLDPQTPGAPSLSDWNNLPPVQVSPGLGAVRAQSEALLTTPVGQAVMSWGPGGRGSTLLLAGGGFWRWEFMGATRDVHWGAWWRRAVKWMAQPEVDAHITVEPAEHVVGQDAPVRFAGRALDAGFQPLPEVTMRVTVISEEVEAPAAETELVGGDLLTGEVRNLPPGRYRYEAAVSAGGQAYPPITGVFAVDSLTVESRRLEADPEFLREIAQATGGRVFDPSSLTNLPDSLRAASAQEVERAVIDLWAHPAVFALFVVLASLEWFLRRRRGLV